MKGQIVALSVDKVQTFLTEIIHSHIQEKQTEEDTLQGIINASDQISKNFFESVQKAFPEKKEELLKCSGVYIFQSELPEQKIEERLNSLFGQYYLESQGQKLLRWVRFPVSNMDEITAIQKAKRELKRPENWNEILEKNRELLFSFHKVQQNKQESYTAHRKKGKFKTFVRDINALKRMEERDKNRFRIAVIKADLDGMGAMFKGIKKFEEYKEISSILNDEISLEGLDRAASKSSPFGKNQWLFPMYIAGDDVFFAVSTENLIDGINVCRGLIETVNTRIEEKGLETKLAMSIGVEITFNREPIRYYMEMVETQLKNAKAQKVPEDLEGSIIMKIAIGDMTFFDVREAKQEVLWKSKNLFVWSRFLDDVKLLSFIRSEESKCSEFLGTSAFFYTLLQDITDEELQRNPVRYMNHVFYHLLPQHLEASNKEIKNLELLLNTNLIYQLCGQDKKINLSDDKKQEFQTYLRLMIMFSDVRFHVYQGSEYNSFKNRYEKKKKHIYSVLFKQPVEYLYNCCLLGTDAELTALFVQKTSQNKYLKLRIETSMFFRLRDLEHIPTEKAAKMIGSRNTRDESKREVQHDFDKKDTELLYFDKEKFCELVAEKGTWTQDFVDSLMLFYRYHEMLVKHSKEFNKRRGSCNGKKGKGKHHKNRSQSAL